MSGNVAGGLKTAEIIKKKYGKDFYARIGAKGGADSNEGGFASNKEDKNGMTGRDRARKYGAIGGSISKRGKVC